VNDDGLFMDDLSFAALAATVPCDVRVSHDFGDVLAGYSL